MSIKPIIMSVLTVFIIIISVQNIQDAHFNVLFWRISLPMIVFILILLLLGFLAGYLVTSHFSDEESPE